MTVRELVLALAKTNLDAAVVVPGEGAAEGGFQDAGAVESLELWLEPGVNVNFYNDPAEEDDAKAREAGWRLVKAVAIRGK